MEKKLTDFEGYVEVLARELNMDASYKESICEEIKQNLYDKYSELLIKGHGLDSSVADTLGSFEDPKKLAVMFNKLYGRNSNTVFSGKGKVLLVIISATLLIALSV
ncbi:MAG TPA: hypothetical protein VEG39_09560 [Clostridia bacterium]|nr:hypothetical protein [Clostridia bacterium]